MLHPAVNLGGSVAGETTDGRWVRCSDCGRKTGSSGPNPPVGEGSNRTLKQTAGSAKYEDRLFGNIDRADSCLCTQEYPIKNTGNSWLSKSRRVERLVPNQDLDQSRPCCMDMPSADCRLNDITPWQHHVCPRNKALDHASHPKSNCLRT
jgi:hypothetical protein